MTKVSLAHEFSTRNFGSNMPPLLTVSVSNFRLWSQYYKPGMECIPFSYLLTVATSMKPTEISMGN
jgi:hypothetical protein